MKVVEVEIRFYCDRSEDSLGVVLKLDAIKEKLGALEGRQATTAWLAPSAHK